MSLEVGAVLEGKVTGITKFGAFVSLPDDKVGMVHISEVAGTYVKEITDHLQENQIVRVKVLSVDEKGRIGLSVKQAMDGFQGGRAARSGPQDRRANREPSTFEDMMLRFKQESEEKISDLKRGVESKRGGFSRRGSSKY